MVDCLIGPWPKGPGPLGPGALGAPGPKLQDTHGECNYLLSGKLPTVRQSYLLSGKLPTVRHAPNNRIHAPNILPSGRAAHRADEA